MSFGMDGWSYQEVQNAGLTSRDVPINGNPIDPNLAFEVIAEDAFKRLKYAYEEATDFIISEVEGGFHFIIKIGSDIYRIVINSVNALLHAAEFIFNKIKIGFEKLKRWLGYVFNWSDFVVTHNFLKTMFNVYSDNVVNGINSFTGNVETLFNNMTIDVTSWANISTLPKIVAGNNPPPDSFYTPHGYYMIHHYKNGNMSVGNPQDLQ